MSRIDFKRLDNVVNNINHVAFIMDGNRRWAVAHGMNKLKGHKYGVEALRNILKLQRDLGIKVFTFFAFSKDNKKKRGEEEYNSLMDLFNEYFGKLKREIERGNEDGLKVKVSVFGNYKELREDVVEKIDEILDSTKDNRDLFVNFCINYNGQDEILQGVRNIVKDVIKNKVGIDNIDENLFKEYLYTKDFPSPEIIVRTGNSPRLSGFLLWDSQYSEIYFSEKMWPDFNEEEFYKVLKWFSKIERKFGK